MRVVTTAQVRGYLAKAEDGASAVSNELESGRAVAATSLAIHAGINSADAVCGLRLGRRAAGRNHDQVLALHNDAGTDGIDLGKQLRRLLVMKTKAEYEPDDIPLSVASRAVDRALLCVAIARRVQGRLPS